METIFKNYNAFILLLLIIPLVSCSSNDDNTLEPTVAELLANQWFFTQAEDASVTPSNFAVADECQQNSYLNFNENGTVVGEFFRIAAGNCISEGMNELAYVLTADDASILFTSESELTILYIDSISESELILDEGFGTESKFHYKKAL